MQRPFEVTRPTNCVSSGRNLGKVSARMMHRRADSAGAGWVASDESNVSVFSFLNDVVSVVLGKQGCCVRRKLALVGMRGACAVLATGVVLHCVGRYSIQG